MKKLTQKFGLYAVATLAFVVMLFLNIEKNDKGVWEVGIPLSFAQIGGESGGEFVYKMEKDKPCEFTITAQGHVSALHRILGISGTIGAVVDLGDATVLYSPGGTYRLGDDVTCAELVQSIVNGS